MEHRRGRKVEMATQIEEVALPGWDHEPFPELRTDWRHRVLSRLLRLPTDEEVQREIAAERAAEANLPERVPPDDPERLAWEAELRAMGLRPAKIWDFPVRKPLRRPDWRDWIRNRLGG
jgi:hypothetical protein